MSKLECAHCGYRLEIDYEDLPKAACDYTVISCDDCDLPVAIGWYATMEVRTWETNKLLEKLK